jgi:predicted Zn-dependent protease
MKKLILSLAIFSSALAFAQKDDVNAKIQATNQAAMDAYNAKNYVAAAPKFMELYNLLKANGQDNKTYMYYAGLNYVLANNLDQGEKIYTDLVNTGFTGVETTYTAKEKKSGQLVNLDKATWDVMKKAGGDYTDFKTEQTPSLESDLYETLSSILLNTKKNDQALAVIEKGLAKFPNSTKLKEYHGSALYATGNNDKFIGNLKEQLAKNPNDATNWYNLGVMQLKAEPNGTEWVASLEKATQLKPDMAAAYQNLVFGILGDDQKDIDEIQAAKKAGKDDLINKLIDKRKVKINKAIPYAEKWVQAAPTDVDALNTLRTFYINVKNNDKATEIKKRIDALPK